MNNYQTLKFPLLLFPVTAIYQWQIATECNCRWYICQCKEVAILEPSNLLLRSYLSKHWTLPKASGIPQGPQDRIPGTRRMKDQSNLRPILQETLQTHSRTSWSFDPTWNPRNNAKIDNALGPSWTLFWFQRPEIPTNKKLRTHRTQQRTHGTQLKELLRPGYVIGP